VTNTGDVTLTGVAVTDPLTGGALQSGGSLGVGQSEVIDASYALTQANVDANAPLTNTATVTDSQNVSQSASASVLPTYAPEVSITKAVTSITDVNGDGLTDAGDIVNYAIAVTNTGDVTLTGVAVTDPLTGGTLQSGGTLGVGQSEVIDSSYVLTQANVDANAALTNTATVTDSQNVSQSASASVLPTYAPEVSITKAVTSITDVNGDGLTDAGDIVNYAITVTNAGDVTLTGVTVADPLTGETCSPTPRWRLARATR